MMFTPLATFCLKVKGSPEHIVGELLEQSLCDGQPLPAPIHSMLYYGILYDMIV